MGEFCEFEPSREMYGEVPQVWLCGLVCTPRVKGSYVPQSEADSAIKALEGKQIRGKIIVTELSESVCLITEVV